MSTTDTRAAFEAWWLQTHTFEGPATIEDVARRAFDAGHQAATEAAKATGTAPLPKWIDDQKGKDPLIDDLIHYIETLQAWAARKPAPVDDITQRKAAAFDEWIEKTEWVQKEQASFHFSTLGKHRADVVHEEINWLRAALAATAAPVLSDEQIDHIVRSYFADEHGQTKAKGVIHDALLAATRIQP